MSYLILEEIPDGQIGELRQLLQQLWWCTGRDDDGIHKMIDGSDMVFSIIERKSGKIVGFARVLTDFIYRGLLLNVVVDESFRGKSLGKLLVDSVVNHPKLKKVKNISAGRGIYSFLPSRDVSFLQEVGF